VEQLIEESAFSFDFILVIIEAFMYMPKGQKTLPNRLRIDLGPYSGETQGLLPIIFALSPYISFRNISLESSK
jgi:hypothetical protein